MTFNRFKCEKLRIWLYKSVYVDDFLNIAGKLEQIF